MSFAIDVPRFSHGQIRETTLERHTRVFALTLVASIVLHVAAVVLGPAFHRGAETPPKPLEVSLVRPPVPEPVRPPPRVQPKPPEPPKPVARAQPQQVRPQPTPTPAAEQRQVLALPEPAVPAPSTFSVPQASTEPQAPAPEAKVGPSSPAPAPAPVAAAREVPSTPPIYNAGYLRNVPPRYPLIARRNGVEGTVRLKVFVSRDGKPVQVQLDRSSGSAALDSAALEAVRGWQFVPARRGQEPIESWVLVPVVFRLEATS